MPIEARERWLDGVEAGFELVTNFVNALGWVRAKARTRSWDATANVAVKVERALRGF